MSDTQQDATRTLAAHVSGDALAASKLLPLMYDELRRLALRFMRHERRDHTLQPTALVNEAYLRLVDQKKIGWEGRTHFFAIAARQMRRVLVEHARAHHAQKRGGDLQRVTLQEDIGVSSDWSIDLLALDQALTKLAKLSSRQSQVLELRVFAGMTVQETAHVLEVSERTIKEDWRVAKAWLARELRGKR